MPHHALRTGLALSVALAALPAAGNAAADPMTPPAAATGPGTGHPAAAGPAAMPTMVPHAPDPIGIGLAATRLPKPGRMMLAFRAMHMDMRQLVDGDDDVSTRDVATMPNRFAGKPGPTGRPLPPTYRMAPENMTTDMYMLGAMAGLTEDIGVMAMIPYVDKEMQMVTFAGPAGTARLGSSQSETSGVGDVAAFALHRLLEAGAHHAHAQLGLSFPTGSITEKGNMLMPHGGSMRMRLPYGMQLGTGTYDLLPGVVYWGEQADWSWGMVAVGRIHLGENDEGYAFGDRAYLTGWGQYGVGAGVFLSLRLIQEYAAAIDGRDPQMTGTSPATDPDNYGGWKTSSAIGVTWRPPFPSLQATTIGTEVVIPVYQNLNGPQLKDAWAVWAGIRTGFSLPGL